MDMYTLEDIRQGDAEEVTEFLLKHFFPQVPIGKVVDMDVEAEVRPWLGLFVRSALSSQVCVAVRDARRGNCLAAVGINCIEHRDSSQDIATLDTFVDSHHHPKMWMNLTFLQVSFL